MSFPSHHYVLPNVRSVTHPAISRGLPSWRRVYGTRIQNERVDWLISVDLQTDSHCFGQPNMQPPPSERQRSAYRSRGGGACGNLSGISVCVQQRLRPVALRGGHLLLAVVRWALLLCMCYGGEREPAGNSQLRSVGRDSLAPKGWPGGTSPGRTHL